MARRNVEDVVEETVTNLVGTWVAHDAPLMGPGLDSIAAVDLVSSLGDLLSTTVEPTALFDHPTIESLARHFASQIEPTVEMSVEDSNTSNALEFVEVQNSNELSA